MGSTWQIVKRIVNLALIFAVAYMLAEIFGYAYALVPGTFPLLVATVVTLLAGGAWQWRRRAAPPVTA